MVADEVQSSAQDIEITVAQRMFSAISGSVFTSLLGITQNAPVIGMSMLIGAIVTPLDVVRVRQQSQSPTAQTQPPTPQQQAFGQLKNMPRLSPQSFANLPPNLGVTACCREVFWVTNNAPFCVAGPNIALSATTTSTECFAEEAQRKTINSTFDGLRKIARNEGITTLWRGLSPTLLMAIPGNVIYFAGYDWLRYNKLSPLTGRVSDTYVPLLAGSIARVLAAIAVSPVEMLRTRMQASDAGSTTGILRDTVKDLREMGRTQGYTSLWRGLGLTLWRDVPFSALYWWGYEQTRDALTRFRDGSAGHQSSEPMARRRMSSRSQQDHASTLMDSFIAGALSGAVASIVTTPFDVGKTRQQVTRREGTANVKAAAGKTLRPEEQSMPRFLWHIMKEEGMSGLFKGWAARTLKVAPACAIMISSYELGKKMAGGINERKIEGKQQ